MQKKKIEVTVDSMIGERTKTKLDLDPEQTVKDVLDEVSMMQAYPAPRMNLVKDGETLPREKTLSELGVQSGTVLNVLPHDTRGGGSSFLQIHERRLDFEGREIQRKGADLTQVSPDQWDGSVAGAGRWAGRRIRVRVVTPPTFPMETPRIYVLDELHPAHPNVWPDGELCMNHTGADWNPNLTLVALMESFRQVLATPNYQHPVPATKPNSRRGSWLTRFLSG